MDAGEQRGRKKEVAAGDACALALNARNRALWDCFGTKCCVWIG